MTTVSLTEKHGHEEDGSDAFDATRQATSCRVLAFTGGVDQVGRWTFTLDNLCEVKEGGERRGE